MNTRTGKAVSHHLLDAAERFRQATDHDDLWGKLHQAMAPFEVSGLLYGFQTFPDRDNEYVFMANSLDDGWLNDKFSSDLFYCDEYVQAGKFEADPVLWSDTSRLAHATPEAMQSLAVDLDYGIVTGVTVPMPFANGLGGASIGCHAANLSLADFDRIWAEHGAAMAGIVNAFDVTLRQNFAWELFPLSAIERECLLRLASGDGPKEIAYRFNLTAKRLESIWASVKTKMRATTRDQALASALIFGLINP